MTHVVHQRDPDDPRPVLAETAKGWTVRGYRCSACGYRLAARRPRCPVCRGSLDETSFGPGAKVWAATVLRTGVPDREPPIGLVYVDLDDGPRVLCHFPVDDADGAPPVPAPGTRVELAGLTKQGDPEVRIL